MYIERQTYLRDGDTTCLCAVGIEVSRCGPENQVSLSIAFPSLDNSKVTCRQFGTNTSPSPVSDVGQLSRLKMMSSQADVADVAGAYL